MGQPDFTYSQAGSYSLLGGFWNSGKLANKTMLTFVAKGN
jgi:hypothetical protein